MVAHRAEVTLVPAYDTRIPCSVLRQMTQGHLVSMMRLMRYAHLGVVLFVAAACGSSSKTAELADAGGGGADGSTDGSGCTSFATLLPIDTCKLELKGDFLIGGTYDTSTHIMELTQGHAIPVNHARVTIGSEQVEVIFGDNLALYPAVPLRVVGPVPLAIVAGTLIAISAGAQIDVSAGGAGAQTLCVHGAQPGVSNASGASGGGGGGFGAQGGRGGDGARDGTQSRGGSEGRATNDAASPLHGGCPGASGGAGTAPGGDGGQGGGAIYLVAGRTIAFSNASAVNAGGGAGRGATSGNAGGGGGGSGGLLMLEAPKIARSDSATVAAIVANGGGGGGGGANTPGGDGSPATLTMTRASGGNGATTGGQGGSRDAPTGEDVTTVSATGGAGGGGGVGVIRIKSADLQISMISPAPQ